MLHDLALSLLPRLSLPTLPLRLSRLPKHLTIHPSTHTRSVTALTPLPPFLDTKGAQTRRQRKGPATAISPTLARFAERPAIQLTSASTDCDNQSSCRLEYIPSLYSSIRSNGYIPAYSATNTFAAAAASAVVVSRCVTQPYPDQFNNRPLHSLSPTRTTIFQLFIQSAKVDVLRLNPPSIIHHPSPHMTGQSVFLPRSSATSAPGCSSRLQNTREQHQ